MTKKSIFILAGIFLITFSLSFAVSDVRAESVKMATLDCGNERHVIAELNDLLADDTSSEEVIGEESEDEEVVTEEPGEGTEEVDEGSDEEMEEDTGEEFPDYEAEEEPGQDF